MKMIGKQVKFSNSAVCLINFFSKREVDCNQLRARRGIVVAERNVEAEDQHDRWVTVEWNDGQHASHRRFYLRLVRGEA